MKNKKYWTNISIIIISIKDIFKNILYKNSFHNIFKLYKEKKKYKNYNILIFKHKKKDMNIIPTD